MADKDNKTSALPDVSRHSFTQSNHLIKAQYQLTLQEKRLIILAGSKINPTTYQKDWKITVRAADWVALYGDPKNAYRNMSKAVDDLLEQPLIQFRSGQTDKRGEYEKARWVSWAKYYPEEGKVELEMPTEIRKYLAYALLEEDGYTAYKLLSIAKLKTQNSIRMYEFMAQMLGAGKDKQKGFLKISPDELRERLALGEAYARFSNLKQRIIEPAVKDINKSSNFSCEYSVEKKGRKVAWLLFKFELKDQGDLFSSLDH